jgi:hypothetical protein
MPLQPESRANLKNLLVKNIHSTEAGRIEQFWLSEAKRRATKSVLEKSKPFLAQRDFVECGIL